jgi:AP-2 complex subunit alpha
MANMRGLTVFIADIRNCTSKDAEQKRVLKEMAKIREKFSSTRRGLSSYDKKKYVWKLLYMHMLGYEVDFGYRDAVYLICSPKYTEKYTGYVSATLLLTSSSPELEIVTNAIRNDISSQDEIDQSMALATVGNLGGKFLATELGRDVEKLLSSDHRIFSAEISKKALACLTRLFKEDSSIIDPNLWRARIRYFLENSNIGLILSSASLLQAMIAVFGNELFGDCVPLIIHTLYRLVMGREVTQDYMYYGTPSPWLQVKLFRLLQLLPVPNDSQLIVDLRDVLDRVLSRTEVTKSVNKNNADHGILFEAIKVILYYSERVSSNLITSCADLLGKFISVKEANVRYIGLETMVRLAELPDGPYMLERHLPTVMISLSDPDLSIRKRALDVIFSMCHTGNAVEIVESLLRMLPEAEFSIKEDIVLKTAVLAEKFGNDLKWYIDVVMNIITYAGDFVSDDIWFRVVQVISGFGERTDHSLQAYAAGKALERLQSNHVHEAMVKLGATILGDFGYLLSSADPNSIFDALNIHISICSDSCKAIILTSLMKLANSFSALCNKSVSVFEQFSFYWDPDIQQRAIEYLALCRDENSEFRSNVVDTMPSYSEDLKKNNMLLKRLSAMASKNQPQAPKKLTMEVREEPARSVEKPQPPQPANVDLLDL